MEGSGIVGRRQYSETLYVCICCNKKNSRRRRNISISIRSSRIEGAAVTAVPGLRHSQRHWTLADLILNILLLWVLLFSSHSLSLSHSFFFLVSFVPINRQRPTTRRRKRKCMGLTNTDDALHIHTHTYTHKNVTSITVSSPPSTKFNTEYVQSQAFQPKPLGTIVMAIDILSPRIYILCIDFLHTQTH